MASYTLSAADVGSTLRMSTDDVLEAASPSIGTRQDPPSESLVPNTGRLRERTASRVAATDVGSIRDRGLLEATASPVTVDEALAIDRGSVVSDPPAARNFYQLKGFEGVTVAVVDEEGNLVEDAAYAYSVTPLRTGAKLENGVGNILLNTAFAYSEFVVIGESDRGTADFAWQTIGELQEPINSLRDDRATIIVDPQRITGLYAGNEISIGGSLK